MFCGTRRTQTSLWVSRVAAVAAVKSELLSWADGPMKERHHQTLSVASSRVSLGCLFGKSVGGILRRKSQPIDDERHLGASLDFSE